MLIYCLVKTLMNLALIKAVDSSETTMNNLLKTTLVKHFQYEKTGRLHAFQSIYFYSL
jgi:hypothetical protein